MGNGAATNISLNLEPEIRTALNKEIEVLRKEGKTESEIEDVLQKKITITFNNNGDSGYSNDTNVLRSSSSEIEPAKPKKPLRFSVLGVHANMNPQSPCKYTKDNSPDDWWLLFDTFGLEYVEVGASWPYAYFISIKTTNPGTYYFVEASGKEHSIGWGSTVRYNSEQPAIVFIYWTGYNPQPKLSTIWLGTNSSEFTYPELRQNADEASYILSRPNFGIALSGGGMRASTQGLGILRGLQHLDVYAKARYVSSNSGGSWVNGPSKMWNLVEHNVEYYVGKYIPPEECTLDNLRSTTDAGVAKTLKDARVVQDVLKNVVALSSSPWCEMVYNNFLKPYDPDYNSLSSKYTADRPYTIINGSVMDHGTRKYIPCEFTPTYCGIVSKGLVNGKSVGDILVDPYCYTSSMSAQGAIDLAKQISLLPKTDNEVYQLKVPGPKIIISLTEQIAISSGAIQTLATSSYAPDSFKPTYDHFSITRNSCDSDSLSGDAFQVSYCDGGVTDNSAVLALLRRGVNKIVSFTCDGASWDIDKNASCQVKAYFGKCTGNNFLENTVDQHNRQCKVFPEEKWYELMSAWDSCRRDGKPMVYLMQTPVLKNELCGVRGGFNACILFMYNSYEENGWIKLLPDETRKNIEDERFKDLSYWTKGQRILGLENQDFNNFPYADTQYLSYKPELVGAMSHLTAYDVVYSKDMIASLLQFSDL